MCGLVATLDYSKNGFYISDLEAFKNMLIVDSIRGSHSTGAFCIDKDNKVSYAKAVGNPYELIDTPEYKKLERHAISKGWAMAGHNRHATQGSINTENAHPFHEGDITLIHNGTIRNHHSMKEWLDNKHINVDSHLIAHLLNTLTPEEVSNKLQGAWALIWHDKRTGCVYAMRNKERPLYLGILEDIQIHISSEAGLLNWFSGTKRIEFSRLVQVEEDMLYTFYPDNPKYSTKRIRQVPEIKSTFCKPSINTYPIVKKQIDAKGHMHLIKPDTTPALLVAPHKPAGSATRAVLGGTIIFEVVDLAMVGGTDLLLVDGITADGTCKVMLTTKAPDEHLFYEGDIFKGKVTKIRKNKNKSIEALWIITVEDAKPTEIVVTKNGESLTEEEFEELGIDGCVECGQIVNLANAKQTVYNTHTHSLFCPDCSVTNLLDKKHKDFPYLAYSSSH